MKHTVQYARQEATIENGGDLRETSSVREESRCEYCDLAAADGVRNLPRVGCGQAGGQAEKSVNCESAAASDSRFTLFSA
jgi:hypothetical protein